MKILKTFIFLVLIISCTENKTEENISKFDKVLGKENVATLDFLVSDFENEFLKRQYANLNTENAYRQFLSDLRDDKTENWKSISESARQKFETSDLRLEMYIFPDSVWIIENNDFDKIESDSLDYIKHAVPYIKSRYKYANPDGTIEYSFSRRSNSKLTSNSNFDSIIKRELNRPNFNYIGKYLQALKKIKNKTDFLKEYYQYKSKVGFLNPRETAEVMLSYGIDLNDELNKKIIVLELAY